MHGHVSDPRGEALYRVRDVVCVTAGHSPMTDSTTTPTVTRSDIATGLRRLGIEPGAGLIVHSSLKSFGHVVGGARTVIEALMEVVTPDGTIVIPSFNHGGAFGKKGAGYYHPGETPTSNGAIPDLFWRMPDVYRSIDPTHPFAAWGSDARRYTEFHHRTLTMGPQSPLGLLQADGGYGLLLGVTYRANTFHHVVEMTLSTPCLGQRTEAYPVVLPDGRRVEARTWGWREKSCPFTDGYRYHEEMQAVQKQTTIGASTVTLFRLADCFEVIAGILRTGKEGFPPCSLCPIRPRKAAETVPSDWDAEKGVLMPESASWGY